MLSTLENKNYARSFLVLASLFFYGWWTPKYIALLLLSMVINFFLSRKLLQQKDKALLSFGVIFNLALLGYYKYANFFVDNVNTILDMGWSLDTIILPLAISFFTFQQIAYLIDCHKGKATQNNSFLNYALFITFFPQLIAGPIVHHREMMPQFARSHPYQFRGERVIVGLTIIAIGLFKKVVIADNLDLYATPIFNSAKNGETITFAEAWIAAFTYSFQIYFDFSGYSDMALGLARLFGIRLPANFFSPYKSNNIIDFWRRWHMTLSRFLRDYLYIPLGGNRKGKMRRHINLIITMLLGGLWHGAAWTFVIWGALHGFYLAVNHFWNAVKKHFGWNKTSIIGTAFARVLTFFAVVLAWVFFRAETSDSAFHMVNAMFNIGDVQMSALKVDLFESGGVMRNRFGAQMANLALPSIVLSCIAVWFLPNTIEIMRMKRPYFGSLPQKRVLRKKYMLIWKPSLFWALYSGLLITVSLFKIVYEPSQTFLYFQF